MYIFIFYQNDDAPTVYKCLTNDLYEAFKRFIEVEIDDSLSELAETSDIVDPKVDIAIKKMQVETWYFENSYQFEYYHIADLNSI